MVSSRSWLVLVFGVLRIDWESSAGFANQSLSEVGSSRNLSSSRRDCVTNHKRVWEGDYFSRCLKTAIMMVLSPVRGMSDRDGHGIKWIKECLYRRWKKWLQLTSWSLCCLFVRRDLFNLFHLWWFLLYARAEIPGERQFAVSWGWEEKCFYSFFFFCHLTLQAWLLANNVTDITQQSKFKCSYVGLKDCLSWAKYGARGREKETLPIFPIYPQPSQGDQGGYNFSSSSQQNLWRSGNWEISDLLRASWTWTMLTIFFVQIWT